MRRTVPCLLLILAAAVAGGISFITVPTLSFGEVRSDGAVPMQPNDMLHTEPLPRDVLFLGDIFLGRRVETYMDRYGADFPYRRVSFASTTVVVGNFEAPSPREHRHTPDLTFRFSVDQAYLPALRAAGVSYAGLANNHAYDAGPQGFVETREALARAGIVPFGDHTLSQESSVTIPLSGGTVAVVGVYAVDQNPPLAELATLVAQLEETSDVQVAYVHWGAEYTPERTASTARLAALLADIGFDAIIGHHPHVVQDIELINGVPVFYSLGNFIFDQFFSLEVERGLGVGLSFEGGALTFTLTPYTSEDARSQPRAMVGEERERFLQVLAEKSDPALAPGIAAGSLTLPCASCNSRTID